MRKIALFLMVGGICSVHVCHADYCEPGAARPTGGGGGTVSFECPPPRVTCYSHTGSSTTPTDGDQITLTIGDHQYTGILVIGSDKPSGGSGQGGSIILDD